MAYQKWSSEEKVKKYSEKRYKSFDQRLIDRKEKKIVKKIFYDFNIQGKILDIPCGYGRFHTLLNEFGEIQAADNGELIAKYQKENVGLAKSTTVCDAGDMPYADNTFEAVFSIRLIQHIHNSDERIRMFREFSRVSKKWIIVSLYINNPLHNIFKKINKKKARITFLDNEQIHSEFSESGLTIVSGKLVIPGLHGHKIFLAKIK